MGRFALLPPWTTPVQSLTSRAHSDRALPSMISVVATELRSYHQYSVHQSAGVLREDNFYIRQLTRHSYSNEFNNFVAGIVFLAFVRGPLIFGQMQFLYGGKGGF